MSKSLKLSIAVVATAVVVLLGVTGDDADTVTPSSAPTTAGSGASAVVGPTVATVSREERLVRPDSPRLTLGTKATFVEFLDFECESCGAIYPTIEDLKKTYGDRVGFVVRHMPLHTS